MAETSAPSMGIESACSDASLPSTKPKNSSIAADSNSQTSTDLTSDAAAREPINVNSLIKGLIKDLHTFPSPRLRVIEKYCKDETEFMKPIMAAVSKITGNKVIPEIEMHLMKALKKIVAWELRSVTSDYKSSMEELKELETYFSYCLMEVVSSKSCEDTIFVFFISASLHLLTLQDLYFHSIATGSRTGKLHLKRITYMAALYGSYARQIAHAKTTAREKFISPIEMQRILLPGACEHPPMLFLRLRWCDLYVPNHFDYSHEYRKDTCFAKVVKRVLFSAVADYQDYITDRIDEIYTELYNLEYVISELEKLTIRPIPVATSADNSKAANCNIKPIPNIDVLPTITCLARNRKRKRDGIGAQNQEKTLRLLKEIKLRMVEIFEKRCGDISEDPPSSITIEDVKDVALPSISTETTPPQVLNCPKKAKPKGGSHGKKSSTELVASTSSSSVSQEPTASGGVSSSIKPSSYQAQNITADISVNAAVAAAADPTSSCLTATAADPASSNQTAAAAATASSSDQSNKVKRKKNKKNNQQ